MDIIKIVNQFANAINQHSVDALDHLMSDDHTFIDGMGTVVRDREQMKTGWSGYFNMVPDYKVDIFEVFVSGNTVALLGEASGTYTSDGRLKPENFWKIPAAWRAVVSDNKIKEWQVYADNEPIRQIMRREGTL